MNRILTYLLIILPIILQSCDIINNEDRLIEVAQVAANKTVMIIEFTDQKCVNCPAASDVIEQLKEEYPDKIISVSVHAYITNLPLVTATGKSYNTIFQPAAYVHPAAMIDGSENTSIATEEWSNLVRLAVQEEADADLTITCSYDSISKTLTAISQIRGVNDDLSNLNLQLWLTEDSISSYQLMSDGSRNNDYVHNNVFRAAINGNFGENFNISPGLIVSDTTTTTISDTSWNIDHLNLVGFIYTGENFNRIIKTVKTKVLNE